MAERLSITANGAKLNEAIQAQLDDIKKAGTFKEERVITSEQAAEINVAGRDDKVLNFCANNYLGLANSKELIEAAKEALDSHGFGLASVRFICGTTDIHKQLEALIAKFHGMEDCILYSSCFDANGGFFEALFNAEDAVISDQLNHASIIDGIRLCKAKRYRYNHCDLVDLERILQETQDCRYRCIVTDGVFSMEGDLCKLPEIVELKHKYNCSIMVDEAHGLGVFGRQGRGVCDHFGLTDEVDLIMGTFSKSLASIGGFIASDKDTINYLRHTCRTYIFSASNTPAATAAALEALHILQQEPERIDALWKVTKYALRRFREEGFEIGDTESPIIPLYVHDTFKTFLVTKLAFDAGVFINPVIPPACAPQDTLVRFALMATHTEEEVERGVQALTKIFKEQGIIK